MFIFVYILINLFQYTPPSQMSIFPKASTHSSHSLSIFPKASRQLQISQPKFPKASTHSSHSLSIFPKASRKLQHIRFSTHPRTKGRDNTAPPNLL